MTRFAITVLLAVGLGPHALAWNALGHKVIAEIAWQQLEPETRIELVNTLRRHPRFADDFFRKMPADVEVTDKATQDHWTFLHAATWPDIAREIRGEGRILYDRPTWHYVNGPVFAADGDRAAMAKTLRLNLSSKYPTSLAEKDWNIIQAWKHVHSATHDSQSPSPLRAISICWLMHLTGDAHQPMHSCALFSVSRYPEGDRGGNEIPLLQGKNLHSLWDNLLGRQDRLSDIDRRVAELSDRDAYGDVWAAAAKETDVRQWLVKSHNLAKTFAYDDAILTVVRRATPSQPLERIVVSGEYLKAAGQHARRRVLAAGLRLAVALDGFGNSEQPEIEPTRPPVSLLTLPMTDSETAQPKKSTTLTHWLNTETGARHNSSCRWYGKTKHGRYCTANEGKPCGQCGG